MAEMVENVHTHEEYASNSKGNTALTLGIIGTALGAMTALGGGLIAGMKGNKNNSGRTDENIYNERKEQADYVEITKEFYQGKLDSQQQFAKLFFDAYERDVNNSFGLYKLSRDNKDELNQKIADLTSKVDVMAAIRPYQDALINAKIDKNALLADYNLSRRTCRMIEGQLVLPSTPEVTGFSSYYPSIYVND